MTNADADRGLAANKLGVCRSLRYANSPDAPKQLLELSFALCQDCAEMHHFCCMIDEIINAGKSMPNFTACNTNLTNDLEDCQE